ncbi:putative RNA-binding protein [Thermobacillus composti KWC4]|jgi:spoIIIJ-associated protein|uniref:RNA-binding protein KhpB n=2 Tax=Thermobacillus TaxID=76632 RepID=L0EJF0_THECK|nr:RNA-binding cell elongation regulator Jag/EloR [Thermobacillus composti]AGA59779.1 putative RNA-binding protein [Thermobacillus composti KWC4]REJ11772.1 MAG: protein jag [Paenibacillaceae bacterium]
MKKVTASGKTIEAAVNSGLEQLGTTIDRVKVNVLEQPSRGLFGLFGARPAKVELTLIEEPAAAVPAPAAAEPQAAETAAVEDVMTDAGGSEDEDVAFFEEEEDSEPQDPESRPGEGGAGEAAEAAERFLREVAGAMGITIDISRSESRDGLKLAMSGGEDMGLLIGRRGQTLDALQYLANIVASRSSRERVRIVLDAENFRERRRKTLEELSERLAQRVVRTGKEIVLEPMTPQERKVIHTALQHHPKVKTFSKGDEPNRRVVITLK